MNNFVFPLLGTKPNRLCCYSCDRPFLKTVIVQFKYYQKEQQILFLLQNVNQYKVNFEVCQLKRLKMKHNDLASGKSLGCWQLFRVKFFDKSFYSLKMFRVEKKAPCFGEKTLLWFITITNIFSLFNFIFQEQDARMTRIVETTCAVRNNMANLFAKPSFLLVQSVTFRRVGLNTSSILSVLVKKVSCAKQQRQGDKIESKSCLFVCLWLFDYSISKFI